MKLSIGDRDSHKYTALIDGKRAVNITSASEEDRTIEYVIFCHRNPEARFMTNNIDVKLIHDDDWEKENLDEKSPFVYGCDCEECNKYIYTYLGLL